MPPPTPPQKPFRITTALGQARLRIDRYLQQALPAISRHKVHELIEAGLVFVSTPGASEPHLVKKSYKVGADETIEIYFRDQPPSDVKPEAIDLDIRFEDDDLLVVNKPAGMVTHPAHGHFSGTLVNALLHHLGLEDAGANIRPGIVHRLDKGTSGLLVVAKNEIVHRKLTEQFAARKVSRVYTAIVWGRFKEHEGEIDEPLGRHPGDRKRFAVVKRGGKIAITTYRVEETYRETTQLTLRLKTGRTHQIRTHLEHEGHPVFGDSTYGGRLKRVAGLPGARKKFYTELLDGLPEFALHAQTLGFVHPRTSEHIEFAAELPGNLSNILNLLRQDAYKELDKMS